MNIRETFLTSKLGRRFFFLFVSCALIPIVLLAFVSFVQVKEQLNKQREKKIQESTKSIGLSIYERLTLLNNELKNICYLLKNNKIQKDTIQKNIFFRFNSLIYFAPDETKKLLYKSKQIRLDNIERQSLVPESSKTQVNFLSYENKNHKIFMSRSIREDNINKGFLTGSINTEYLWKGDSSDILPPNTEICVVNPDKKLIISSIQNSERLLKQVPHNFENDKDRSFQWSDSGQDYIANYWPIFMESRFTSQPWIVILSKPQSEMISPILGFHNNFILVFLLSILSVTLLSMFNIRRILIPLEKIKSGIQQISNKDFSSKVNVSSNDEFADVAHTFNEMTYQLDEQFRTIETMSQIDRLILSSLNQDQIILTMLKGFEELLPCNATSVHIQSQNNSEKTTYHFRISNSSPIADKIVSNITWQLLREKFTQDEPISFDLCNTAPWFISPEIIEHSNFCYILPIFLREQLVALITLAYPEMPSTAERDLTRARQLADQMAVALDNSSLVQKLDNLHWASVRALAKTVDAKSSWTAGHSERVCSLAVDTASTLGMDKKAINNLRQGALLHDIGKVGISNAILDKPGKLTDEEFNNIKKHPRMGAQILEPINEYSQILPIVQQHHENFDGSGYPDGLARYDIVYEARILAVADVFDALSSSRPYRPGWPFSQVISFMKENSGLKFDPQIVDAFLNTVYSKTSKQINDFYNESQAYL